MRKLIFFVFFSQGLDPDGPIYCFPTAKSTDLRLDESDANYVQVISTSGGFLGCDLYSATQTYHPNGGTPLQPACLEPQSFPASPLFCAHDLSTDYFRLALNKTYDFGARRCRGYLFYQKCICDCGIIDRLGFYAKGTPGKFYLSVRGKPPYI